MDLFDVLNDIMMKRSGGKLHETEGFDKVMSTYMVCRYLSMRQSTNIYGTLLNKYQGTLSPSQVYLWLYDTVPKQTSGFIPYLKRQKKPKAKQEVPENYIKNYLNSL